jgi:hypothetical protein
MYDPVLGRFLSPDPLVSDPENTQSYNRYSYCMNNPLKYVDKNGLYPIPTQVLRNGKWVDVYVDSETREVMSDDEYQHWLEATGFDKDTKIQLDDEGNILIKGRVYSENDMFEFDLVEYFYTELQHADEDEFVEKACDYINAKEKLQYLGSPLLSAAASGGDGIKPGDLVLFESSMKLKYDINDGVGIRSSAAASGYISYRNSQITVSAQVLHGEKFIDYKYVANVRLRYDGNELFYSLQPNRTEARIIDPIYNYIGSATFSVPQTTGNIYLDVYVGYWVYNDGGYFNGTYFHQTYTINH